MVQYTSLGDRNDVFREQFVISVRISAFIRIITPLSVICIIV